MDGIKHDNGKLRWTLLPWEALEKVVRVLQYGANKYKVPNNWRYLENGKERYTDAALRHIVAHLKGEIYDPESGIEHLAHAACNLLFVLTFMEDEQADKVNT